MANHRVYLAIVQAVKDGQLVEPFTHVDFRRACPGFADGTYQAFLYKHRKDNLGGNSELFEQIASGKFRLVRPFQYGFD